MKITYVTSYRTVRGVEIDRRVESSRDVEAKRKPFPLKAHAVQRCAAADTIPYSLLDEPQRTLLGYRSLVAQ
jgi:hypothetical protein